jgi:hypothetical protein
MQMLRRVEWVHLSAICPKQSVYLHKSERAAFVLFLKEYCFKNVGRLRLVQN